MSGYGRRYLTVREFSSYCSQLNVKLGPFDRELELYEREGLLFPVARVVKPCEYIIRCESRFDGQHEAFEQDVSEWDELERLLTSIPPHLNNTTYSNLWHPFDQEFERKNRFLLRPSHGDFEPWDSFRVEIESPTIGNYKVSSVQHYYHYWQVYQVHQIQKRYPVFAKYAWNIQNLSEEARKQISFLKPQDSDPVATLYGRAEYFDALSFYIELHHAEEQRAFAPVPTIDGLKQLSDEQLRDYQSRLGNHARFVLQRYGLTVEELYQFLVYVLNLHTEYQRDERIKLADKLEQDILYLTRFIVDLTNQSFDEIEEKVGRQASVWTKKKFRHLDRALAVQDYARETFERLMSGYNRNFRNLNISLADIDRLLRFVEEKGVFIIPYAIFPNVP
jgi:hypothetical protein